MASRHACESLSLASCRARARRLFSRASHSASTSRPKRSSKARAVMSAWCCCSVHAAARASSLSAWSFSSVGAVSIVTPSLVVVPPAEMFVDRGEGELRYGLRPGEPVEPVLQDRVDMAIGAGLDGAGAGAGGLEPLRAVALGEAPPMGRDALAAVKDLDGRRGQARVDVLVQERVGDGVVMAVELDVVVDVDASPDLPVAVDERLRGERAERRLIKTLEEVAAAGAVEPHRPGVEIRQELGDPRVEGGEGEEGLVPEAGEDPPLRDLHGDFDLRLVSGL